MTAETSPLAVDLNTDEMTALFAAAPVYRKSAVVTIRAAAPGETVATVMANGRTETAVACKGGEPVITNPGGERYVLTGGWGQVARRYDAIGDHGDNRYQAKGMIRAFRNPTGAEVTITAPWGEEQNQGPDCMFATEFFPGDPERIGADRYLIGGAEFAQTYAAVRAGDRENGDKPVPPHRGLPPRPLDADEHQRLASFRHARGDRN